MLTVETSLPELPDSCFASFDLVCGNCQLWQNLELSEQGRCWECGGELENTGLTLAD